MPDQNNDKKLWILGLLLIILAFTLAKFGLFQEFGYLIPAIVFGLALALISLLVIARLSRTQQSLTITPNEQAEEFERDSEEDELDNGRPRPPGRRLSRRGRKTIVILILVVLGSLLVGALFYFWSGYIFQALIPLAILGAGTAIWIFVLSGKGILRRFGKLMTALGTVMGVAIWLGYHLRFGWH